MAKALLINSSVGEKEAVQGTWHLFEQATPYIQGIKTGDLLENVDAEILSNMISGLPSIWSRAKVFGYAFKYTQKDANIDTSGLINFYETLVNEWKGLIALLALFPDRIVLSKPLEFTPGLLDDLYKIPNAFGRMLFEDTDLWCDPKVLNEQKKQKPQIQLIYYNNLLIGATSPYSLIFTGIDYSAFTAKGDVPWFRNGRFDDPLEFGNFDNNQLQKLYLLVSNLANKLPEFEREINLNREGKEKLKLTPQFEFIQKWSNEIKARGFQLVNEGALDAELEFAAPFTQLFRIKQDLFLNNGNFSFDEQNGGQKVDLQKILMQDDFIYSLTEVSEEQPLENSAVYYMTCFDPQDAKKKWYFPIPLSDYGLRLFKNRVGELLSQGVENAHEIRSSIKVNDFKLVVELFLLVDGKKQTPIVREYEIKLLTGVQRNIIIWPNFVSKNWNQYYFYNEYPSNARDIKFVPFYKNISESNGYDGGNYIADNKEKLIYGGYEGYHADLKVEHLVKYPVATATREDYPYEVIRSNRPVAGVEIRALIGGKDRTCGYLIVKEPNDESMRGNHILDFSHETNFEQAVVGIDFGSNNSCLSYSKTNRSEVEPIPFKNRRIFLLGAEVIDHRREKTAVRNELLFFQNEETANGQIKSWVHDHKPQYVATGMEQEEIAGGVPIFEHNLIIHGMDSRTITTNAGILHHSMKWLNDIRGKEKKKAYLKSVWIMAIADLYANKMLPIELRWSYPGSFTKFDVRQYQLMYDELSEIPIEKHSIKVSYEPSTEAEAVCNYALTNIGLDEKNILLGIDVGGSTSDILVLGMDSKARAYKLSKQSSLRMAAGILSEVIKDSNAVRQAIYKYHESPVCPIKVANIKDIIEKPNTAPFYLNAILDRLKDNEFRAFYSALAQFTPEVFVIPAYVTGLLLYYSGQLVSKAIKENQYQNVRIVDFLPFGKGGRIFDWLDVFPGKGEARNYYNSCFKAGFGEGSQQIDLEKKDSIRHDNKSEVSKGLSAPQEVTVSPDVRENSDLFGESGFVFQPENGEEQLLRADDVIKIQHLQDMKFGIRMPDEFAEFNKFFDIFIRFVGPNSTGIIKNAAQLQTKKAQLARELKAYILNDSEWQKANEQAKTGQPFDYKHSMLILEGLCFLEKFIIPELK